jgi:peptidoglycan-N-acetylglucosamine deacetylase
MGSRTVPARTVAPRSRGRWWRWGGALALVVALAGAVAGGAVAGPAAQGEVTDFTGAGAAILGAESVNLRDCPSFDCDTIGTLAVNDRVTVTGPEEDAFLPVESESGLAGYAYALYVSVDGQPAPWFTEGAPGCNRVAIAFNIGVGYPFDYGILDTLQEWDVPATFFAMGWTTDREPETVEAIREAGFPIGTHGYTSIDLPTSSEADVVADLQASIDSIQPVAGDEWVPYHTPFAASTSEGVRTLISSQGILPVGWQISTADYRADITADDIWGRVVPNIYDGAIIEMHIDAVNSAGNTGVALPWIIDALQQRGYQFVSIPDMTLPCGVTTAGLEGEGGDATPAAVGTPDGAADGAVRHAAG